MEILPFGERGGIKMLYDVRQRPQAVYLKGTVFIAFKGGGPVGHSAKPKTSPMLISYDPRSRSFSETLTVGPKTTDHHHGPVIWADEDEYLHVLFGCHKTPGTHLISNRPAEKGRDMSALDTSTGDSSQALLPDGVQDPWRQGTGLLPHGWSRQLMDLQNQ